MNPVDIPTARTAGPDGGGSGSPRPELPRPDRSSRAQLITEADPPIAFCALASQSEDVRLSPYAIVQHAPIEHARRQMRRESRHHRAEELLLPFDAVEVNEPIAGTWLGAARQKHPRIAFEVSGRIR